MDGIRLHIGCGSVYLLGDNDGPWTNVDIQQSGAALASDRPLGVERWGTTADRYYDRITAIDKVLRNEPPPDDEGFVCDAYGSFQNLPFPDASVRECYSVQCFEHLSRTEAHYGMAEMRRVLKTGGILRLDIPDISATWNRAVEYEVEARIADASGDKTHAAEWKSKADFMKRHAMGSRRKFWAHHMAGWERNELIDFCARYGFKYLRDDPNIHTLPGGTEVYPALAMRFEKLPTCEFPELDEQIVPWKAAWEYCGQPLGTPLTVPADWQVLEIGPGANRWPRANAYADIDVKHIAQIKGEFLAMPGVDWPECVVCDVCELPKDWIGRFDFVFLSHILEHCTDPAKAAAEISRVAKAGCIVCPSPFKEGMFLAHEQDHRWWVVAGTDRLYFHRLPEGIYGRYYEPDLSGEMHRIWRYGERRIETICNKARKFFHDTEPWLDCVFRFQSPLQVVVCE